MVALPPSKLGVWRGLSLFLTLCPLQANLIVQENRHVLAMQDLQKAQAELDDKQAELDVVQAEYEQAMTEKQVSNTWPGRDAYTFCSRELSLLASLSLKGWFPARID